MRRVLLRVILWLLLATTAGVPAFGLGEGGSMEWTLEKARKAWHPMWRATQHVGVPGYGWQPMVLWDGSIILGPTQYATSGSPTRKEAEATLGEIAGFQHHMCFAFGEPMKFVDRTGRQSPDISRRLLDGRLPIPVIETRDDSLVWQETVFSHLLGRPISQGMKPAKDDNLVVHAVFRVVNRGHARANAHLWMYLSDTHTSSFAYESTVSASLGRAVPHRFESPYGRVNGKVRYVIPAPAAGKLTWHDRAPAVVLRATPSEAAAKQSGMVGASLLAQPPSDAADNVVEWSVPLAPGAQAELRILVPLGPVGDAAARQILALDSDRKLEEVSAYWTSLEGRAGRIVTPDPFVNDYAASVVGQMAQHVAYRRLAGQWHLKTSPNVNELYWPCNGGMALPSLDLRALSDITEPVLRTFMDTQTDDVGALPTDRTGTPEGKLGGEGVVYGEGFAKVPGFLGNVGEWTSNTVLVSHGVELWALAQHYRILRDDRWLGSGPGSPLQAMLDGFDWVITQRKRTMREIDGKRVAHWGMLPAASAHDWFSGNTIFNDAYCIFGMAEVVRLLRETRHPLAEDKARELVAYKADLRQRYIEARDKARELPLDDGTEIPYVPRDVYELDWARIDWTYTGYGPLRAGAWGALDPHDELVDQSLAFLEAGFPKGQGPRLHVRPYSADENWADVNDREAPRHWIWRNYVEYETMWPIGGHLFLARDDLPRFFEWLFCNLAVTVHPDWLVGVEALDGTPSNSPGDAERWRGIRNMFVNERGGYDGGPQSLWLLQAIPRSWLKPNDRLSVRDMGTCFGGKVDLEARTAPDGNSFSVNAEIKGMAVSPSEVRVRLRSGDGRPLASATVNGKAVRVLDSDTISLPAGRDGLYRIVGTFR